MGTSSGRGPRTSANPWQSPESKDNRWLPTSNQSIVDPTLWHPHRDGLRHRPNVVNPITAAVPSVGYPSTDSEGPATPAASRVPLTAPGWKSRGTAPRVHPAIPMATDKPVTWYITSAGIPPTVYPGLLRCRNSPDEGRLPPLLHNWLLRLHPKSD